MTDQEYRDRILAAEATAAAGVTRDLDGLRAVHGDVVRFIESRWERWLDATTERIERDFYAQCGVIV